MASNREIVALDDFEHVRLRPTHYIGSVEKSEEKIPIIKNNTLQEEVKEISVGFYKLLNEILDNSFDEAKRLGGKMKLIELHVNSTTSEVRVVDTGGGFYKGTETNAKTGLTNIESAMCSLRAGSNFYTDDSAQTLIGTHGVGASIVNILSDKFTIKSVNSEFSFQSTWSGFVEQTERKIAKKKKGEETGTEISFIPYKKMFGKYVWDLDILRTQMIFKSFLMRFDEQLKGLEFKFFFDGKQIPIGEDFLPKDNITIETRIGTYIFWKKYENSTSVSFVNGAQCTGIHQKIVNDWINGLFNYNLAHHFYDHFFILNMQPKLVRFGDQNKTKFVSGRWEIEDVIKKSFWNKINRTFPGNKIFKSIQKDIEDKLFNQEIAAIKRKKRTANKKVSDKYYPPSKVLDTLFIVEGNSAAKSLLQRRDTKKDGVYTLKGKIKNARSITDLSQNNEIIDLMSILGIEPKNSKDCKYKNVVMAVDADVDGIGHIASLLINLFYKWFNDVIAQERLHILITPLLSVEINSTKNYFFSYEDFHTFQENNPEIKTGKTRYLKGLGSLSIDDWEWVMEQRRMFKIYNDKSSERYMDMAFGKASDKRKKWLQGI